MQVNAHALQQLGWLGAAITPSGGEDVMHPSAKFQVCLNDREIRVCEGMGEYCDMLLFERALVECRLIPVRPAHGALMTATKKSTLKRAKNPMPVFVREALTAHGLMAAYEGRPPYQQNDYLGWISRAKLETTRQKRLDQMLAELRGGKKYMNMAWPGGRSQA